MGELRHYRVFAVLAGLLSLVALTASQAAAAGRCGNPTERPWCNTKLAPEKRADLLLAAMTPAQRISLLGGDDPAAILSEEHTGLSFGIPELGVPPLYSADGPLGIALGESTSLPSGQALAASFRPSLARMYGRTVAAEARRKGMDVLFAPNLDVLRTPLSGRAFETMGEDPYLITRFGSDWLRGAGSQGVITTLKHFAANNQEGYGGADADQALPGDPTVALGRLAHEGNRFTVDARVGERALREIYLAPYEALARRAGAVMCSYNRLNGEYACENKRLLNGYLRKQFGFKGMVIADYNALHDPAKAIKAGLDYEPWPGKLYGPASVQGLVDSGAVTQAEIDARVRKYLETLLRFGVFDREAYPKSLEKIDWKAHRQTARTIAGEGTVMLKNDGILPLKRGASVAVIGQGADNLVKGGGSSNVDPPFFQSPLDSFTARLGEARVAYADGSDQAAAVAAAKKSEVAIVFAADYLTEGVDRRCLTLECPPAYGDQDALIRAVAQANPRTVVVLETGGPVLTPWRGKVSALLEAWYPGEAFGPAIVNILYGRTDPGGRLPSTFPARESQIPLYGNERLYPGVDDRLSYADGVNVGYRSYIQRRQKPAYPFGFGLSYGKFRYGKLRLAKRRASGEYVLKVPIRNVGRRDGKAVPQIYLQMPGFKGNRKSRRLAGFGTVQVKAGKRSTAKIIVRTRDLRVYDVRKRHWKPVSRCPVLLLGSSSTDLTGAIRLGSKRRCSRIFD